MTIRFCFFFAASVLLGYGELETGWQYYSQSGQDRYANETFFHDKKGGVFVDIGAYDGIHISNTYFFEEELGWTGVCIEPIPEIFEKLLANRRCACVQGCISDEAGEKTFLRVSGYPEMLSGLTEKYDPAHLVRIQEDILRYGGACEEMTVPCFSFNQLMEKHGISHIDFLSVDTEGGEFDILSSIDYEKYSIDVITVEDNYSDPRFVPLLESKGYRLDSLHPPDLFFVRDLPPKMKL